MILWGLALVLTFGACSGKLASPTPVPPPAPTPPSAPLPPVTDAEKRCDVQEMSRWSDDTWHDIGAAYIGATILVGIAGTDYSQTPDELESYREFLKGTRNIVENEWNALFETHVHVKQTVMNVQNIAPIKTATTVVFLPDFPSEWVTRYQDIVNLAGTANSKIRANEQVVSLPPEPLRAVVGVLDNQFHCRIAEARRLLG